jgi:hypothetical protein
MFRSTRPSCPAMRRSSAIASVLWFGHSSPSLPYSPRDDANDDQR